MSPSRRRPDPARVGPELRARPAPAPPDPDRPGRRASSRSPASHRSRCSGVRADLAPLVVASVGLLCGSIPGAAMGFGVGPVPSTSRCWRRWASPRWCCSTIGYGAGRLRELRDPAHGLVPLAVGAAATAVAGDRLLADPVPARRRLAGQPAAAARHPGHGVPQRAASRCRCTRSCAARCLPLLPDDPRRRRRRAYTTGGLSPISRS